VEASQRYIPAADVKRLLLSGPDDEAVSDAYEHLLTGGRRS
jgi:hypothetical protein